MAEEPSIRPPQLQMTWPTQRIPASPDLSSGYRLRCYQRGDTERYAALMESAGFEGWTPQRIAQSELRILPGGFFVVEHIESGELAATAVANHAPTAQHPYGGEMGWVAAAPEHRGKGLGQVVCAAVVQRLLSAGYQRIYLLTDDWRLPAIRVYLRLGFEPLRFDSDMAARWDKILVSLGQDAGAREG